MAAVNIANMRRGDNQHSKEDAPKGATSISHRPGAFKTIFSQTRHVAGMPPGTLTLLIALAFLAIVLLMARWMR